MSDIKTIEVIRYAGVQISREGVAKVYGARTEFSIPKHEICGIRLVYGVPGERRWLELSIGVILLGLAVLQILSLLVWLMWGGSRDISAIVILFSLIGLGGWLTWDALRKQWYIEVETFEKTRKLAFDEKIDHGNLKIFVQVGVGLGYSIDSTSFDATLLKDTKSAA